MNGPRLGARLSAAAGCVRAGSPAADIGCDHGKLAVWLAANGRCPSVVAADLRPGPLAKAQLLARRFGVEDRVSCRLGDGLSVIREDEAADFVIAGMGGELTAAILGGAPWRWSGTENLVLVPASAHDRLRAWLCRNGFGLVREQPVTEAGHVYTVMQAAYTGRCFEPEPLFCAVGLLRGQRSPAAGAYFLVCLNRLRAQLGGSAAAGRPEDPALRRLAQSVEQEALECAQ